VGEKGLFVDPPPKLAVLVDFDETAAEQNVAELLLRHFGPPEWEVLRQQFRAGGMTLQEYQETTFRQIRANRQEMGRFAAARANLRPGFLNMADYCQTKGIHLAIVSCGLDFYIQALLDRHGVGKSARIYAVGTRATRLGLQFLYPHANPACHGWGNCKCRVLEQFRGQGDRIVYVGDGRSDFCPAVKADLVFARGVLLQHCQERGVAHHPFEDFTPVLAALRDGPFKSG
jgi:2,3-diketo-5-methylthio-1-phosphopentane phosphatase